jgi:hypothetical protein
MEEGMRMHAPVLAVLTLATTAVVAEEPQTVVRFADAPLRSVLDHYAETTGKRVEIVQGVSAFVTLQTKQPVTAEQYSRLLEAKLKESNIGLFTIATNRIVATWIDARAKPATDTAPSHGRRVPTSYRELLEKRRAERQRKPVTRPLGPKLTGEKLQERLREYNMDLIRKGDLPLPIKLTPEEDAQLVKEGVLPPIEGGPADAARPEKKVAEPEKAQPPTPEEQK